MATRRRARSASTCSDRRQTSPSGAPAWARLVPGRGTCSGARAGPQRATVGDGGRPRDGAMGGCELVSRKLAGKFEVFILTWPRYGVAKVKDRPFQRAIEVRLPLP